MRSFDLFGSWEIIGDITGAQTGLGDHQNPGLARNDSSSLFIDADGWAYVFFGDGVDPFTVNSWKLSQARFRIFETTVEVVSDSFRNFGGIRRDNSMLADTAVEVGAKSWSANEMFILNSGTVETSSGSSGSGFSMIPLVVSGDSQVKVSARLDIGGGSWSAIGFSRSVSAGLFGGELWILLNSESGIVTAFADGTINTLGQVAVTDLGDGFNDVSLIYHVSSNSVSATVNGQAILDFFELSTLKGGSGFVPDIQAAGFGVLNPVQGATKVDDFRVNGPNDIFLDGFEVGDFSRWD
jgi:hypothetical protein